MNEEIPQGIKITKDITLVKEFSFAYPIYICEGVTVSADSSKQNEPFNLALYADTAVLVNYGTCAAGVWTDSGASFLNFGRFEGGTDNDVGNSSVWLSENSYSIILNEGYMLHQDCSRLWENNHLLNTPTGTLEAENFFLLNASLSNYGAISLTGKQDSLNLNTGSQLNNFGTLTITENSEMRNNGLLYNKGSLLAESGSKLWNGYLVKMILEPFGPNQERSFGVHQVSWMSRPAADMFQRAEQWSYYAAMLHQSISYRISSRWMRLLPVHLWQKRLSSWKAF